MDDSTKPILQLFDAYKSTVWAKDVEAFVSLYTQDVFIFDMWGEWSFQGIAAWRAVVSDWFGSVGADQVGVDFSEIKITSSETLAFAHAFVAFRAISAAGVELRSMTNRLTWSLRKEADGWKIVHQHTSAPFDPGAGKLILRR